MERGASGSSLSCVDWLIGSGEEPEASNEGRVDAASSMRPRSAAASQKSLWASPQPLSSVRVRFLVLPLFMSSSAATFSAYHWSSQLVSSSLFCGFLFLGLTLLDPLLPYRFVSVRPGISSVFVSNFILSNIWYRVMIRGMPAEMNGLMLSKTVQAKRAEVFLTGAIEVLDNSVMVEL